MGLQARRHPCPGEMCQYKIKSVRHSRLKSTMSFRRPKASYKRRPKSPSSSRATPLLSTPISEDFVVISSAQRAKRPRHSAGLFLPGPEELIALPGHVRLTQTKLSTLKAQASREDDHQPETNDAATNLVSLPAFNDTDPSEPEDQEARRSHTRRKKNRQDSNWNTKVIPSLLPIYLRLLHETESLRLKPRPPSSSSSCRCPSVRQVSVTCLYFERLDSIDLSICACSPITHQLMLYGLFPCAPTNPSLAVDLSLLQFTRDLFVRAPPNMTSYTEALESFLDGRGYELHRQVSLRRRFATAFKWYSVLVNASQTHVQNVLEEARYLVRTKGNDFAKVPSPIADEEMDGREHPVPLSRPTEYLRSRCPLCFGGEFDGSRTNRTNPDVIVCLDACFTQKRRKGSGDNSTDSESVPYPPTFIPQAEVDMMESYVNHARSVPSQQRQPNSGDGYEGPLRVPMSVLDGCQESFTAADERRQKASTKFFSDTGLMAMLCRHDRVLWLTNMTTSGEKQYYALSLIKKLFENIPDTLVVGLLYDIACQLHRSFVKWGFLPEYVDRIIWGLSVFHAYGHQWPCQIIYHPRKCMGFGLSDGEGCERFWSAIKKLIPTLRVSGASFDQRLSVLDLQVQHISDNSLETLGNWLVRKWHGSQEKKHVAEGALIGIEIPKETLRERWHQQVQMQTQPAPRQSKHAGEQEIEAILVLEKNLKEHREQVLQLEGQLRNEHTDKLDPIELEIQLQEAQADCSRLKEAIGHRRAALGVSQRAALQRIKSNVFFQVRMNARAVKTRIRDRLRQRKFELELLERTYRHAVNEHKLTSQTESSVKRREPGIMKLAKTYNDLCQQMSVLAQQRVAPRNVALPKPIDTRRLFALDVDDDIWEDVGLVDNDGAGLSWLSDDATRNGIQNQLVVDRCLEEEDRLKMEVHAMRFWMQEEWGVITMATATNAQNPSILYQLKLRKKTLARLCLHWQAKVRSISWEGIDGGWGVPGQDLLDATILDVSVQSDGGSEDGSTTQLDDDDELIEELEIVAFTDAYNNSLELW